MRPRGAVRRYVADPKSLTSDVTSDEKYDLIQGVLLLVLGLGIFVHELFTRPAHFDTADFLPLAIIPTVFFIFALVSLYKYERARRKHLTRAIESVVVGADTLLFELGNGELIDFSRFPRGVKFLLTRVQQPGSPNELLLSVRFRRHTLHRLTFIGDADDVFDLERRIREFDENLQLRGKDLAIGSDDNAEIRR